MRRVKNFFQRTRSYTYQGMSIAIGGFLARFVTALGAVGLAQYIGLPNIQPDQPKRTLWELIQLLDVTSILVLGMLLVIADYAKDYFKERSRVEQQKSEIILYRLISGTIETFPSTNNHELYFATILRHIEMSVESILGDPKDAKITANLMVVNHEAAQLELKHWGTKLDGREDITIKIDPENPVYGAGKAYHNKTFEYIMDTLSPEYKNHFSPTKDYRTIISIPIFRESETVIAVVNIDCNIAGIFSNKLFVDKFILPRIKPLLSMIYLRHKIIEQLTKPTKPVRRRP